MTGDTTDEGPSERIETALRAVRIECVKAAVVYAMVDAAVVFLGVNVAVTVLDPGWVPGGPAVPAGIADPLAGALGLGTPVAVPGSALVAGAVALVAFAAETWLRLRRPPVEQFEAANPAVAESLRTARDAAADGADSPMAARLYGDVLDGLAGSSGAALVDWRRVLAPGVLFVALVLVTPGAAVADVGLFGPPGAGTNATDGDLNRTYTGLRDGDSVLGDSESVSAGDEELTAAVESTGAGRDETEDERQLPSTGGAGSGGGSGSIDSQQAGFTAPERVEEADLVLEYNRRIREEETE